MGAELPLGFSVYAEPSVQWVRYDAPSYYVKDYRFQKIREKDRIHRYLLRLSNKNLSARGFTPEIDVAYTDKKSTIWQKEYNKLTVELSFVQSF